LLSWKIISACLALALLVLAFLHFGR